MRLRGTVGPSYYQGITRREICYAGLTSRGLRKNDTHEGAIFAPHESIRIIRILYQTS